MPENAKFAMVFPGQGSQSVGMLAELATKHAVIEQTFTEASDVLGYDLWSLAQFGSEEKIKQTEFTQPLMYTSGIALWRLWCEVCDVRPVVFAGHSLGEFCALTAAGAISFADCLPLVHRRARLMGSVLADGEGGMAAILGMDDEDVIALCESIMRESTEANRVVEAVNFNSPGQVAISGHSVAVQQACELARDRGAKRALMLPVSVPNHSSLMRGVGHELAGMIDRLAIDLPVTPVVQNTNAEIASDRQALLVSLKQHVYSPVQWTQSYRLIMSEFVPTAVIELGPGKVLTGLGKRIDRSVPVSVVESHDTLQKALERVASDYA